MDLTVIEQQTKSFSTAHSELVDLVMELNRRTEAVKNSLLRDIKKAVQKTAERKSELQAAIDESRQLFDKPRTVVFHGVKVGLAKRKGKLEIEDDDKVVALIKKHFEDLADVLIHTEEKPVKKALEQLSGADLKKLGITVGADTDAVVITPVDSEVEKIVSALLKDIVNDGATDSQSA
jgi:hypothetical protein